MNPVLYALVLLFPKANKDLQILIASRFQYLSVHTSATDMLQAERRGGGGSGAEQCVNGARGRREAGRAERVRDAQTVPRVADSHAVDHSHWPHWAQWS